MNYGIASIVPYTDITLSSDEIHAIST